MGYLSRDFLSNYDQPRNKGILFDAVRLRSYSRWLPDKRRRETWLETVQRVVEHSLSLYPKDGPASIEDLTREAELMFDKIFHLEVLPAGRSLWVAGTEASKKFGSSLFNCAYLNIDSIDAFSEMFQLLLNGCGVGFGVQKEYISKLPTFNINFTVKHQDYNPWKEYKRQDETSLNSYGNCRLITIGDSREGWTKALKLFLGMLTTPTIFGILDIEFNYDNIRPSGQRIKSFGGRAPGPDGIKEMFINLEQIIKNTNGVLGSVDCIDIANFIAKNVIVGGTRRSSQIALGDEDDQEFIEAKKDLWISKKNLQRTMSNNSIAFKKKPSKEKLAELFDNILHNGEPGFWNYEAVQKKAPNRSGSNPCNEILLDSKQFCNLTCVNVKAHIENGVINFQKLKESFKLATRIGLRHTNITVELPEWDYKQKRDRLLGVSMTGIMDAVSDLGGDLDLLDLDLFKKWCKKEARKYAHEMRVPEPLLVTCIKPEGSLSQLPTVSSGIHSSYAPYFIRRIRVSSIDPVAKALAKCGVPYKVDPGKAERWVFEFPISTNSKKSVNEESVEEQFNRYLTVMDKYVDHNCSITITVSPEEKSKAVDLLYQNWDKIIGCAWLPKNTTAYPLMPYEEIDVYEYIERKAQLGDLDMIEYYTNYFENEEYERTDIEISEACETGGSCPIR